MLKPKLIIGVTLGDPAGIGPEVALKAAAEVQAQREDWKILLAGSYSVAQGTIARFNIPIKIKSVQEPEEALEVNSPLPFLNISDIAFESIKLGQVDSVCANLASASVKKLAALAAEGRIVALACAPVNKQAVMMSSNEYADHTTLIAQLFKSRNYGMFFTSPNLAVMSVTGHIALKDVPSKITVDSICQKLELAADTYYKLYGRTPRIAVCSLDPHCGEGGLLGMVDIDIVKPAVDMAGEKNLAVEGPIPADAVFRPFILKKYDLIFGMYHDQIKVGIAALDSDRFVSFLAGVPIIRTTTSHGTAFDIAGKGVANSFNMKLAIETAGKFALKRLLG